jgi:FMN reductase
MSREIVFVEGSPSPTSRSSHVARFIAALASREGFTTRAFSLRDFDPADVLFGRGDTPEAKAFVEAVKGGAAVVLSSPVYKASYAGGLKAIVDLIPPDALAGRPALGIATTRLEAHGPQVDRAYRALFAFFDAKPLDPLVVFDSELRVENGEGTFGGDAKERVDRAARALLDSLARP